MSKKYTHDDLREALQKLLPGYKWTGHRPSPMATVVSATGIESRGFNRMSTVEVVRREAGPWFETAIYGYGTRSEVMGRGCGTTLAKAVRVMQDVCANQAGRYRSLQESLEKARAKKGGKA